MFILIKLSKMNKFFFVKTMNLYRFFSMVLFLNRILNEVEKISENLEITNEEKQNRKHVAHRSPLQVGKKCFSLSFAEISKRKLITCFSLFLFFCKLIQIFLAFVEISMLHSSDVYN